MARSAGGQPREEGRKGSRDRGIEGSRDRGIEGRTGESKSQKVKKSKSSEEVSTNQSRDRQGVVTEASDNHSRVPHSCLGTKPYERRPRRSRARVGDGRAHVGESQEPTSCAEASDNQSRDRQPAGHRTSEVSLDARASQPNLFNPDQTRGREGAVQGRAPCKAFRADRDDPDQAVNGNAPLTSR